MNRFVVCLALSVFAASPTVAQVSPAQHLGHAVGADFRLPGWPAVSAWYRQLDAASARVQVEVAGETTGGREFLVCAISSEANLARADELRAIAAKVADPRGLDEAARRDLLARGLPIVMISNAMHSNEVAAPQFAMQLAFELATSDAEPWRSVRERALIVILPCTNPDGLDAISQWYLRGLGESYEAGPMPWLYQDYAGHDNNRDWFMLSLTETRLVSDLIYARWHPHVYWDVHQQGSFAERMFVPPFRDPLDPNLDPAVMGAIDLLGTRAALDMTAAGLRGVASGVSFDMWWHGGNRNVPVRHNIIGLLTEAASANLASPLWIPPDRLRAPSGLSRYAPSNRFRDPWPGGWWRVGDIIEYEMAFARSLLSSIAREGSLYTGTVLAAAQRACEMGASRGLAWVIPGDGGDSQARARLADALLRTAVEVEIARAPIEVNGRKLAAGAMVVRGGQPAWRHVHDLFEVQHYPGDEPPYDVAGWSLATLLGQEPILAEGFFAEALERVVDAKVFEHAGTNRVDDVAGWRALFASLGRGEARGVRAGAFVPAADVDAKAPRWNRLPRVAVYRPWTASMDEGWLRWTLEYCGLPYRSVDNARLRSGDLRAEFDVVVIPDLSADSIDEGRDPNVVPAEYTGGLGGAGRDAVAAFVRGGGRLVAIGRGAQWANDLFGLGLEDVAKGKAAGDFACPGSVLEAQVMPAPADPFAPPVARAAHLFFSGSSAWSDPSDKSPQALTVLARYAPIDPLHSGWIRSPAVIAGKAAWVRAAVGEGRVELFAFSPYYRSWSQDTFHWLLRAVVGAGQP